jgi:L-lactate dehydrogenase complex protein LldF
VTTLPPVHIALMGIERLVPTLDDLALMLYLLPRSATGQKLTVYTSLIHGPAATIPGQEDPDGPKERHLILVDNGRTAMRSSPLSEALMCIRCGACLNACPVFREIGGHSYVSQKGVSSTYPGPIGSVVSPGLFGQAEFGHLARASSLCGACKDVCPVDIDLPKLLLRIRAGKVPGASSSQPHTEAPNTPGYLDFGLRMYTWVAKSPRLFHTAQRLAGIFSRLLAPSTPWLRLPSATGWGFAKDFPRPASRPFRDRWKKYQGNPRNDDENRSIQKGPIPQFTDQKFETSQAHAGLSLVDQFSAELTALGGNFISCSKNELSQKIIEVLQERDIQNLQAWEEDCLPTGILEELLKMGIEIIHHPDPSSRAGLTGALAGIAESGTLAIHGGPGKPLTASLLPEIHLAVLHTSDIHTNLSAILNLSQIRDSSAAVLVTGPSRTADIEMTLTIGVHGPREVHVFCIP